MRANLISVRAVLFLVLALFCALVLSPSWAAVPNRDAKPAYAEEQTMLQIEGDSNVREPGYGDAASGRVHIDRHYLGQYGSNEANVIVQRGGNTWRLLRNGPIATITGIVLLVVPLLILLVYRATRPAPLQESGRRIHRFSSWERTVHWATAFAFIALAITGFVIMFGKVIMLPWMGHTLFSWVAIIFKYIHNVVGPVFVLCSILMFFTFLRRNFYNRIDWQWIKQGGGFIKGKHPQAGFFNAGEKSWFWFGVVLLGLIMSITGLILDFVNFGQTRYVMQMADYLHIAGATAYTAAAMGHIYIGTWGSPGAYDSMRQGHVDENWAKTHHGLWYDEVKNGAAPDGARPGKAPPVAPRPGPAH